MELSPIQRLDKVLNIMCPKNNNPATSFSYKDIVDILKTSFDFTDAEAIEISNEMPLILEKLAKDKYVVLDMDRIRRENLGDIGYKYYRITFEGKFFNFNAGYSTAFKNAQSENRIKKMKENLLILGTFLAGIGSIDLVAWEMYKNFCLHQ